MRLLYLYTKFYDAQGTPSPYRGFSSWSINFSTDRHFHFEPKTGALSERQNNCFVPEVPQGFWGERIYNATAFVSSNGGGKSTIMQYMILLLADLEQNLPNLKRVADDWVIVFGIGRDIIALQNKSILAQKPCPTIHAGGSVICSDCARREETVLSRVQHHLHRTKLLYLSNVLGKTDVTFQADWLTPGADRTKRFLFDASACAMIHRAEKDRFRADDVLQVFFTQEQKRMFQFLTSPKQRSLLRKLREMEYPLPVPQQLTVYIDKLHFPEGSYQLSDSPEDLHHWERLAFPRSWQNIWASQDYTPALQVDRLIFSLCCGATAGCLRHFVRDGVRVDLPSMFKKVNALETAPASGGDQGRVVCEEFLILLDETRALLLKGNVSSKEARIMPEGTDKNALIQHAERCQTYIRFLCSQRSRTALSQHLPPADPMEQRFMQLGEQVRLKFVVALNSVMAEEAQDGQPTWFIAFYQQYLRACGSAPYLTLDWGLSSGEENLLKMFTNLQEICSSAGHQKKAILNASGPGSKEVHECTTVWLFLDEADLTYHPEWQRQFMAVLTAFLQEGYPPEICREMQVFLSTHSPLMLGDFPSRCTAYLRCHEDGTKYVDDSGRVDTFGENLFTLLHSSFYLRNGEIGELAKQKIQTVIDFLTKTQEKIEAGELEDADKETVCYQLQEHRDKTVALLADGPIKAKLRLELKRLEDQLITDSGSRESLIRMLEEKLRRLKGGEGTV